MDVHIYSLVHYIKLLIANCFALQTQLHHQTSRLVLLFMTSRQWVFVPRHLSYVHSRDAISAASANIIVWIRILACKWSGWCKITTIIGCVASWLCSVALIMMMDSDFEVYSYLANSKYRGARTSLLLTLDVQFGHYGWSYLITYSCPGCRE